jgi:hypothetical protein
MGWNVVGVTDKQRKKVVDDFVSASAAVLDTLGADEALDLVTKQIAAVEAQRDIEFQLFETFKEKAA